MYILCVLVDPNESKEHHPFFRCNAVLAIPNVIMQPALDEVQQSVNKAAHMVINVSKGISQWNKVNGVNR